MVWTHGSSRTTGRRGAADPGPDRGGAQHPVHAGPGAPGSWHRPAAALVLVALLGLLPACQRSLPERVEEARAMVEVGAFQDAVESLREILEESPDDPEANYLLGRAQVQLRQPTLAIWPLQMAKNAPEFALDASLQLALAYLQLEQLDQALAVSEEVLAGAASDDQRTVARQVRLKAHTALRNNDEAVVEAEALVALVPDDPGVQALWANALVGAGRHDEAESVLLRMWEAGESGYPPQAVSQAGLGLVRLYSDILEQPERARAQLDELIERYPGDPGAVQAAIVLYGDAEEPERIREIMRAAVEAAPTNLDLRRQVARELASQDRVEEGEAVLAEGAEELGNVAAWLALEHYRRSHDDLAGALGAVEEALALVPEPTDTLRFSYGDLLASNERLEEAKAEAEQLGDTVYGHVLRGRIAYEERRYADALAEFDEGLKRWPNNAGARRLAGRSAFVLGDLDRAVSDLREALRATEGHSDAGLDLARIYLDRGEPERAYPYAERTLLSAVEEPANTERARKASRLVIEALAGMGRYQDAIRQTAVLAKLTEGQPDGVLARVEVLAQAKGAATAAAALEASEVDFEDPENLVALGMLGQYLVDAGREDDAVARVAAAVDANPELAALHDVHGRVLFHAARPQEAAAAFERALALDPELARALEGQARLAAQAGDAVRARERFERAASLAPEDPAYPYAAARIAWSQGDLAAAETLLREALSREPAHADASNDLAWLLADRAEALDEALLLARRASAARPTAAVLDTLGWVQLQRDEAQSAAETLERAANLDPASPSIRYRLGLALARSGREARAREALKQALAAGAFPEAAQATELLASLGGADS